MNRRTLPREESHRIAQEAHYDAQDTQDLLDAIEHAASKPRPPRSVIRKPVKQPELRLNRLERKEAARRNRAIEAALPVISPDDLPY